MHSIYSIIHLNMAYKLKDVKNKNSVKKMEILNNGKWNNQSGLQNNLLELGAKPSFS